MTRARLLLVLLAVDVACSRPSSPESAAAEAGYTSELLACVEHATTRAESKACRADVDRRWGVVVVPVRELVDASKAGWFTYPIDGGR